MAIKEYEPGTAFPGVIGRTIDESTPAWPQPRAGEAGRAERAVHRPRRHRLRPARLLRLARSRRPTSTRSRRTGCATTTCTPRRCARRAARASLTGRNHHSQRDGLHHRAGAPAIPGYNGLIPFENGFLSEMLLRARLQHLHGRQVAPDADASSETAAGPYDRWPLGRGFERFYGFLGGDTSQWYPDLVYDNHQVEPPRRPRRATTSPRTWSTRRSSSSPTPSRSRPTSRSSCTSAPARCTRRTTCRKEWADKYTGQFDDGWDAYREKVFAAPEGARASCPPDTELSRHDPDVAGLGQRCRADEKRLYAAHDGGLRRLPRATPTTTSGGCSTSSTRPGELDNTLIMVISDNGASAEGGPHGSINENAVLQQRPGDARGQPRRRSTSSAARSTSTTTRGAGPGPATRRSAAGSARPTAAASSDPFIVHWPQGIKAKGEVRTQYAHIIDMVPTVLDALGHRAARARSAASRSRRSRASVFAHTLRRRQAPSPPPHAVLRDARPPGDLPRRLARGLPVARAVVRRGGHGLRRQPITEEKLRELDANGWELYHVAEDFAETKNVAAEHRDKLIEMIAHLVRRGGQVRRAADRRQRHWRGWSTRGRSSRRRATSYVYYPGTSVGPEQSRPRVLNRPHSITATVEIAERRRGRAARAGRRAGRLLALRQGQQAALRLQLPRRRSSSTVVDRRDGRRRAARAALRVRADRQARPRRTARGRRGARSSTSTASWPAQGDLPVTIPLDIGITEGLTVRARRRLGGDDRLPGAVRLHRRAGEGRRRRLRRAHRGQGRRDAHRDGAPVGEWGREPNAGARLSRARS